MKRVLSSGAGLLLIALAFLAFNMVSGLLFSGARLDLTEQKLYTISPGTKRILAGLDEPINLYFFYSDSGARELVPLRNYARRVEELLRAYEGEANGRIRLQVIDPEPFSENEDKATEFGLQGIPLQQGGDNLYFGLAGSNALDGVQVIPFFPLDQEEFLEYDISRLVQTLAQPQRPVVGLMSSLPLNGGFDMASRQPTSPWMVMEEIRQQFDLRSLKSDATEIPPEVSVLLLLHPKQLPEQTLYAIDQFVLRGASCWRSSTPSARPTAAAISPLRWMATSRPTSRRCSRPGGCGCCRARCSATAPMRCPSVLAGTSVRPGIRPGSACRARRWTRTTSPLPAWKA